MTTLPWFKPTQVELSTSVLQAIDGPLFFDGPSFFDLTSNRFVSQCQLATIEPTVWQEPPTVNLRQRVGVPEVINDSVYRLRAILERLGKMQNFDDNWDSYGSQPPSDHAVNIARNLVWNVIANYFVAFGNKSLPHLIVPLSGAGVQLEWRGSTDRIEVEVDRDGQFGYLLSRNDHSPNRFRQEHDEVSEGDILRLIASTIS